MRAKFLPYKNFEPSLNNKNKTMAMHALRVRVRGYVAQMTSSVCLLLRHTSCAVRVLLLPVYAHRHTRGPVSMRACFGYFPKILWQKQIPCF